MKSDRLEEIRNILGSDKVEHLLNYMNPTQVVAMLDQVDLDALARGDFHLDFEGGTDYKLFTPFLGDSAFVRPFQLYGRYGEELTLHFEFRDPTIYFIAKRKRLRFVLSKISFQDDCLVFVVSVGGEEEFTYRISLVRLITGEDVPEIKKLLIFPVPNLYHLQLLQVQHDPYPVTGIWLDKSKSDENTLAFTICNASGESMEKIALPHILMNLAGVSTEDFSEILYIGQSLNAQQRFASHEKLQQAQAECSDKEDIYVYLFNVKHKKVVTGLFVLELLGEISDGSDEITDQGRLNLVEMALINYFKPKYNFTYVNSEITLNKQVDELLRKNGYTRIIAEVNFDSTFWRFGSSTVNPKQCHAVVYDLEL